jgi:AraC-like DNA-binding protein
MQALAERFNPLNDRMRAVAVSVAATPERRRAALWETLWELAEGRLSTTLNSPVRNPVVVSALNEIESHLSGPLSVADIAARAGVSYSYLGRLFQASLGENVIGYIQRRREERAVHLLCFTTLSIKSIAAEVGIEDLQRFNRFIHKRCGCSPRVLRSRLGG